MTEPRRAPIVAELTPEQKEAIDTWLKAKWTMDARCPISGDVNWQIADHLVQPMAFFAGGLAVGGPGYPQVMLICRSCGLTRYFNAVLLGVVQGAPPPAQEQPVTEGMTNA